MFWYLLQLSIPRFQILAETDTYAFRIPEFELSDMRILYFLWVLPIFPVFFHFTGNILKSDIANFWKDKLSIDTD